MKKTLLIALAVLIPATFGAVFYISKNASKLVASYKTQIEGAASSALGTSVRFGEITVSVFPSTKLSVTDTVIGRTDSSKGLELKSLDLSVRLGSLIRGIIDITALELHSPRIALVKQGGATRIEGLPSPGAQDSAKAAPAQSSHGSAQPTGAAGAPLSISLERFVLDDGVVSISDMDAKTQQTIEKLSIESSVRMTGETLALPSLSISASLPGGLPMSAALKNLAFGLQSGDLKADNIALTILKNILEVAPALNTKTLSGNATVTSAGVDLASLTPVFRAFAPAIVPLNLVGKVTPNIKGSFELQKTPPAFGASGTVGLLGFGLATAGVTIADGQGTIDLSSNPSGSSLKSKKLSLTVNKEPVDVAVNAALSQRSNQLTVEAFTLSGFGGVTNATARLALGAPQTFTAMVDSQNLAIAKLMALVPGEGLRAVSGSIPTLKATLRGTLGDALANSLNGTASIAVKDGALVGTNIIGSVVKQITSLPVVSSGALAGLDPKTKAALDSKDTTVQSLSGDFTVGGGKMSTSNFSLISPYFNLVGTGTVGFDGAVDLATTIYLAPDLSAAIVRNAKGLSKALDSKQQLVLPLKLVGKAPNIKVIPNTEKLLGMAAEKALESGLKNLLKKDSGEGKKKGLGGLLGGF